MPILRTWILVGLALGTGGAFGQEEPRLYQRETPPAPIAPPAWASPIAALRSPDTERVLPVAYGEPADSAASTQSSANISVAVSPAGAEPVPGADGAESFPAGLESAPRDPGPADIEADEAAGAVSTEENAPPLMAQANSSSAAGEEMRTVVVPPPTPATSADAPEEASPALPPRSNCEELPALPPHREKSASASPWPSALPPVVTVVSSLAIVIGLFFAFVWVMRKNAGAGGGLLPKEAFEVLGRAPLVGRQQAQIVRFGNKLVLLGISPDGVEPLAELTDPVEIDRVAGLCRQGRPDSSTTSFHRVLEQVSQSYTPGGYSPAAEPDEYRPPTLASYGRRERRHG